MTTPHIRDEWEPDFDAAKLFEEHMNSLEQLEYDRQCEIEASWDYGEDHYDLEDRLADAEALADPPEDEDHGVIEWVI